MTRSHALARLHGASMKSSEKSPPMFAPNRVKPKYMTTRASMKLGMASPMKPARVTR